MHLQIILIVILGSGLMLLIFFVVRVILFPRRVEVVSNLLKQGKTAHAIRVLRKILHREPRSVDAHYFLGLAYLADQRPELALMELRTVNQIGRFTDHCKEVPFRKQIAELFIKAHQTEEALKEYLLLINAQPQEPTHYYHAGTLFEERSQTEMAANYYQKAIELNGRYSDAHWKLGVILSRQRKPSEARRELELAVEYDRGNLSAYFQLGRLLKEDHEYGAALKAFEKAVQDPALKAKALVERGTCYMTMSNYERAIPELERALRSCKDGNTDSLYGMYFLALCYERIREIEKAIHLWESIYNTQSTFRDVAEKLNQYKELRADAAVLNLACFER